MSIPLSGQGPYTYAEIYRVFKSAEFFSQLDFVNWWNELNSEEKAEMIEASQ